MNKAQSLLIAYGNLLGADQLGLDVEASTTTTATCRRRISDNLELASNQLHRIVNLTSFQQLKTGLVHDNLGAGAVAGFEDSIIFGRYGGCVGERHEILKPMAAARFDCYAEGKLWVGVLGHDFFETLRIPLASVRLRVGNEIEKSCQYTCCPRSYIDQHFLPVLVLSRICRNDSCSICAGQREVPGSEAAGWRQPPRPQSLVRIRIGMKQLFPRDNRQWC